MRYNVILSTSECKYGVGNMIHFVDDRSGKIQILRHPDDELGGFSVIDENGIRFYGYDLILFKADDFLYLDKDGDWFSHTECEKVELED